jgi:hypothetical protein
MNQIKHDKHIPENAPRYNCRAGADAVAMVGCQAGKLLKAFFTSGLTPAARRLPPAARQAR